MAKGIDRAKKFESVEELGKLRKFGYTFIGRYLTKSIWKSLSKREAEFLSDNGFYIVSIYQNANNRADYFNHLQGTYDAHDAIIKAESVGQPDDTVIYFAVDFESSPKTIGGVIEYFKAVLEVIKTTKHKVGVYGSFYTVEEITKALKDVEYKFQTVAWSKGKVSNYNLYQKKCDTVLPEDKSMDGFDLCESNGNGGGWKVKEG